MGQNTINHGGEFLHGSLDMIRMVGNTITFLSQQRRQDKNIQGAYGMQIVGFESFCDNLCYTGGSKEALDGFLHKFRREGWEHESAFVKGFHAAEDIYKADGIAGLAKGIWDIHTLVEEAFKNGTTQ